MSERWDRHFLRMALECASMSKDPNTRVGAVLVGPDKELISSGFNGFPRGIIDTSERLADREMKNRLMVHAEMNAILNAARIGTPTNACTLYIACTDDSGLIWAGPPCTRCTVEIIQAGVSEIVAFRPKPIASKWHADLAFARGLIQEKGISYRELEP